MTSRISSWFRKKEREGDAAAQAAQQQQPPQFEVASSTSPSPSPSPSLTAASSPPMSKQPPTLAIVVDPEKKGPIPQQQQPTLTPSLHQQYKDQLSVSSLLSSGATVSANSTDGSARLDDLSRVKVGGYLMKKGYTFQM
jgi:hypothetical protein